MTELRALQAQGTDVKFQSLESLRVFGHWVGFRECDSQGMAGGDVEGSEPA